MVLSNRSWPFVSAALTLVAFVGARSEAADSWVEARSAHFVVVSDAGEGRAREVAWQFEQIRGLFSKLLPLRTDPARPIMILAARNEESLQTLLPEFWAQKGRARPAGVFFNGPDRHYVALRTDVGDESHHVVYHEYAHLVSRMNYFGLPLWLNEGLAEFYAGAIVREQQIRFGRIHPWHIRLLRHVELLPLETLLTVDHGSPHYNETNRVSIFYAQSAALTHYLMVANDGAQRKKLADFLGLLSQNVEEIEAARRAFGDVKALEKALESYIRQLSFMEVRAQVGIEKERLATRSLSLAEGAAVRGEFLAWRNHAEEARALIESALEQDPQLGRAHQSMGALQFVLGNKREAVQSFEKAARLSKDSYLSHYWSGAVDAGTPSAEDFERRAGVAPLDRARAAVRSGLRVPRRPLLRPRRETGRWLRPGPQGLRAGAGCDGAPADRAAPSEEDG
jgi:tetratricopeptide (TPR) repeat protein